jgi:DNA-binding IclR family transcriptional regulator
MQFQSWKPVRVDVKTDGVTTGTPRPGAPALEKGLDLLELLAAEASGLTQKQIAQRVGRSVSEIFRMLGVLEQRGYVVRNRRTGDYTLTLQLFRLATQYPPTRRLQQAALPVMEALAASNNLSCHLSVLSGSNFLVAATAEPDWPMGWTVKLGAVFPLSMEYASARVLSAFQHEARRAELAGLIARHDKAEPAAVLAAIVALVAAGGDFSSTELDHGVTSLSCPVLDPSGRAAAALTVPLLREVGKRVDEATIAARLRDAARQISGAIGAPTETMAK